MSTSLNVEDEPAGCPLTTGLTVLSWFASTSKLAFLQSREKRASISWLLERDVFSATTGLQFQSWFGFGFGRLLVEQLLNPTPSSNHVSRKSLEEVEVTHKLFRIWSLQFPSEHFSGYNKLGVFREGWLRSIFDVDPIHRVLMFLPCFMHVLCKTRCTQVVCVKSLCSLSIRSTSRKNTVCLLLKFWPPGINPQLMMECKLIAHPTW